MKIVLCGSSFFKKEKLGIKDKLIKDLSNKFITELPIDDKIRSVSNFSEQLKVVTTLKSDKEVVKQDLSNYIETTNLTVRLGNIKKSTSKESDSVT